MAQSYPMNGGDSKYSYSNNSTFQRNGASGAMDAMMEVVFDNLDVEKLLSGSTTFAIADLGCSVGPNTFFAVQKIIETVEQKYDRSKNLEFQVLFNDQTGNDFNALFASLPRPTNYFAAGVPGSFHGRLFPSSSVHIAYSAYAMHWLSKVPEALLVKDSPAWNPGKIHYAGASDAVVKAYAAQFESDMEVFLEARGAEIAAGGMIMILVAGVPDGVVEHGSGVAVRLYESIFMEMVKEGVIEQDQVDSFNVPTLQPSVKDMRRAIEKNGCFEIVKIELEDMNLIKGNTEADPARLVGHMRAASEATFANHFGNLITDQVFSRLLQQKDKLTDLLLSYQTLHHLWVVLKRK